MYVNIGFLLSIDWVLQLLARFRCPGFCATRETAGIVKCPSVDVCLCMKFNNFKSLLDHCSGVSCVQVWWETLRIAPLAAKLYLPVSCRAPLTFRFGLVRDHTILLSNQVIERR